MLLFLGSAGVSRGVKGRWSPADLDFSRVMPYYKFRLPSARKVVQTVGTLATRLNPLRIWGLKKSDSGRAPVNYPLFIAKFIAQVFITFYITL